MIVIKKSFLYLVCLFSSLFAQVTVSINSGDPVYPFPQFLPYENQSGTLNNLATHPGEGVTHAEMEQIIRDAYQIMMNRAVKPGGGVEGIDNIYFQSNPSCSEGDGYALLAAAAMADKETFDGLWLWIHDNRMNNVKKYADCQEASPGYAYSRLPGWTGSGANSAADGDFDIGLALLVAYLQWGEFMGITDACGEPISYKYEAIEFLKALTDTIPYNVNNNYVVGDIGLDGYFKGGDSWTELTGWASDMATSGLSILPEHKGPSRQHIDYTAPSYFKAFADFLAQEDSSKYAWNIYQFRRAEASSDWLMGQILHNEKMIPFAGWVDLDENNNATFTTFSDGEDFRLAWRTILNPMWYGDPNYTWNPETHQVQQGEPNSFESDVGKRYARFLWDSRQEPWNYSCVANVSDTISTFWGPDILKYYYTPEGEPLGTFALNWVPGTGSPSAVVAQDFDLMAQLYRNLEIKWDGTEGGRYITSVPHYFHGWFRLLGMLVLTGNYQRPDKIQPTANMKVYLDIDRTFAFERDTITYTIDYRNYGSLDAQDVTIKDTLHPDFVYISSTGGGVHDAASNVITWNIGTVPGFKTATGVEPTTGQVSIKVLIGSATENQYRNSASITCSNGTGWTSNEYPNNISTIMERNHLDIAKRALVIDKSASNTHVNPGKEIEFTIDFENTSEAGWINGGRKGVHFSFARDSQDGPDDAQAKMQVKLFHDADEAYIDYGNYRVSYFLFDAGLNCYSGTENCTNGWVVRRGVYEGVDENFVTILHENITPGEDENGKWNQRIILQFSDPTNPDRTINLTTTNYHVTWYRGIEGMIHRGGTSPLRMIWYVSNTMYTPNIWSDDWSWDPNAMDKEDGKYFPITNDWTDPDNPDIPVTTWNPKECQTASHTVDNILVEEWDGYTWRRVAGNGPLPGRDAINVVIKDTIPPGFTFDRFEGEPPLGIEPTISDNIITWTIPKLQIQKKGTIRYIATASGACPMQDKTIMTRAWISADKESPFSDSVAVTVTCDSVEAPLPPPTTMYKYADKDIYRKGDTIDYTIAYKQTHGSVFIDASDAGEWTDFLGNGKLGITTDGTINYDIRDAGMVHKYSYGVNGTIGGTITPATYTEFSIVVRQSGSDYVEIRFKNDWGDVKIDFYNNSRQIGGQQNFSYTDYPGPFNFKIKLSEDTISFWAGDTSSITAPLPNIRQTGIGVRKGYAGVMSRNDPGTTISNWYSHFDVAYDVKIHDNLPSELSFISAGGEISTGHLAGTQLTGTNSDGVIEWQVVSGDTYLDYNDSVTLHIKAICEDSPRDSIVNTAFTNLRGYPQNRIAARVSSPVFIEAGPPHHLDIIVDTTAIKLREDEPFNTLTMNQATRNSTIYAVVRDSSGNLIDYVSGATWESRDQTIVTAAGQSDPTGSCLVTKTGEGKTIVVVTQQGLLPDSIEINAIAPPPWPVIVSAIMTDDNGDVVPDLLRIILNNTLKEDQSIIRVIIDYNGEVYNIPFSSTTLADTVLTVPFLSKSGKDPVPSGNVTVVLSVDGSEKRESAKFTDGVGPAISTALLGENTGDGFDTLSIVFTEEIIISGLTGQTLQLISKTTGDTTPLTVESIVSSQSNLNVTVTVSSQGSPRPAELDSLRLVPGTLGSMVTDINGNMVHPFNIPAPIMGKPAYFSSGYYVDRNGDGIVDTLFMHFSKKVELSGMRLSISWGGVRLNKLSSDHFTYGTDSSIVAVSLPDTFKTSAGVKTSGGMYPLIEFDLFPDDSRSGEIADSAAAVILDASFTAGVSLDELSDKPDTLRVTFSEDVTVESPVNPFLFNRNGTTPYTLNLEFISSTRNEALFLVKGFNGVDYPLSSDSIWINPFSTVKDLNNIYQNNPSNRRAALTVQKPDIVWDVIVAPNPYCPDNETGNVNGVRIRIVTQSNTRLPIVLHEAYLDLYDAVGNRVLRNGKFLKTQDGIEYVWDGTNKRGRKVGSGTYLGIISVNDEGYKGKKRVKIGIRRK